MSKSQKRKQQQKEKKQQKKVEKPTKGVSAPAQFQYKYRSPVPIASSSRHCDKMVMQVLDSCRFRGGFPTSPENMSLQCKVPHEKQQDLLEQWNTNLKDCSANLFKKEGNKLVVGNSHYNESIRKMINKVMTLKAKILTEHSGLSPANRDRFKTVIENFIQPLTPASMMVRYELLDPTILIDYYYVQADELAQLTEQMTQLLQYLKSVLASQ